MVAGEIPGCVVYIKRATARSAYRRKWPDSKEGVTDGMIPKRWMCSGVCTALERTLAQIVMQSGPLLDVWCRSMSSVQVTSLVGCLQVVNTGRFVTQRSSVPFAWLSTGSKFAGLSPAKFPVKSPAKKIAPQKSHSQIPPLLASAIFVRPYYVWNTLLRCYYISIIIWQIKNRRSESGD